MEDPDDMRISEVVPSPCHSQHTSVTTGNPILQHRLILTTDDCHHACLHVLPGNCGEHGISCQGASLCVMGLLSGVWGLLSGVWWVDEWMVKGCWVDCEELLSGVYEVVGWSVKGCWVECNVFLCRVWVLLNVVWGVSECCVMVGWVEREEANWSVRSYLVECEGLLCAVWGDA